MKEFIESLFRTSEERIKNPIIASFIFSWIAFNWKPISIFIFSEFSIEGKINTITHLYSNILELFFYPLLGSIFYVLILPFINWLFDIILENVRKKRDKILTKKKSDFYENQIDVEKSKINLEKKKTEFLEENNTNETIQDLNKRNQELLKELETQREANRNSISVLQKQLKDREKQIQDIILNNEVIKTFNLKNLSNSNDNTKYINQEKAKRENDKNLNPKKIIFHSGNFKSEIFEKIFINGVLQYRNQETNLIFDVPFINKLIENENYTVLEY